ncbi:hypothetical protein [Sphingosinithalassobacter sp. LHW66-3]|uniref:hypothetical protein n=1 Tax=Sphingosinithalassobacter sp. LHW66-3 TaxID=3424718 RepID=UPI003D6A8AE4
MKTLLAMTLAAAGVAIAAPALAQDAPINGVVTIFGEDPCPRDAICVRAPETERYRIPRALREQAEITPENQSWAVRQQSALQEGATGVGSCSAVGPGGATGCFVQQATRATAERRQRREQESNVTLVP